MTELEQRFLTLSLKGERYAIPVGRVREILEYAPATRLPGGPSSLKGIINVRGRGIPILDLAIRLGLPEAEPARDTAIVVVEPALESGRSESAEGGERVVGLIADAVHDVIEVAADLIEEPPRFGAGTVGNFLKGVARQDEGFVLILDLDRLFLEEEDPTDAVRAAIEGEAGRQPQALPGDLALQGEPY